MSRTSGVRHCVAYSDPAGYYQTWLYRQRKQTSERLATVITDDARGRAQPTVGSTITRQSEPRSKSGGSIHLWLLLQSLPCLLFIVDCDLEVKVRVFPSSNCFWWVFIRAAEDRRRHMPSALVQPPPAVCMPTHSNTVAAAGQQSMLHHYLAGRCSHEMLAVRCWCYTYHHSTLDELNSPTN